MAEHQVLFCPFCRESFEGKQRCPAHELSLVPFSRLPPSELLDPEHDDDADEPRLPPDLRPVAMFDPSLARGWVALGGLCQLLALALPLARLEEQLVPTYRIARVIPSLWTLGLVAFTVLYVLLRRRTPRGLRGLRVLMPALGAVALASLLSTYRRLGWDAAAGPASYVSLAGALLLAVAGPKLGGAISRARK